MARRVYFSFHYQEDIWRVNQVRNSWVTQEDREATGFYDASLWEKSKKTSDHALKIMINGGLNNTTVTCVLIGRETHKRPWVQYEIVKSLEKGNGIIGVKIHHLGNSSGSPGTAGNDPFDDIRIDVSPMGKSASVFIWKASAWVEFEKYPTIYRNFPNHMHGNAYRLSQLNIKSRDWNYSNGYANFNDWVEEGYKSRL